MADFPAYHHSFRIEEAETVIGKCIFSFDASHGYLSVDSEEDCLGRVLAGEDYLGFRLYLYHNSIDGDWEYRAASLRRVDRERTTAKERLRARAAMMATTLAWLDANHPEIADDDEARCRFELEWRQACIDQGRVHGYANSPRSLEHEKRVALLDAHLRYLAEQSLEPAVEPALSQLLAGALA